MLFLEMNFYSTAIRAAALAGIATFILI